MICAWSASNSWPKRRIRSVRLSRHSSLISIAALGGWKNASYSQYIRDATSDSPIMGYSMTTNQGMRFTAWVDFDTTTNTTDWGMTASRCGLELYNHPADPDENQNVAYHDDMADAVAAHFGMLKAGWRSTLADLGQ